MLQNRYEFMMLVQAVNCNPNGDPDMGNLPRQDPDTEIGYITDAAIKRRVRDYVMNAYAGENGMDIFARNGISINREILEAVQDAEAESTPDKTVTPDEYFCHRYWDARTFGGVLSTGKNAGQIQGAVQIAFGESVDPIDPQDITITRMYYTKGNFDTLEEFDEQDVKMDSSEKRTMGNKQFISYGLYVIKGTASANLAHKNGFSEKDLGVLFEGLLQMYENGASSSKMGMNVVSPLIIFKHVGNQTGEDNKQALFGCCGAQKLYNLLSVTRKNGIDVARKYSDYDVALDLKKLPKGVIAGIKDNPYDDITWGTDDIKRLGLDNIVIA